MARSHLYIGEFVCSRLCETQRQTREFVGDYINDLDR